MAEDNVRKELEALLEQFFSPSTSNAQRLEINQLLEKFSQQQGVWLWHYCIYFLQTSTNQHLLMYSLNLLENLVTYKWLTIDPAQRAEVRVCLHQHLLTHYTSFPRFLVNKIIKVITFIGRSDWPHDYPDFLQGILQLLRDRETIVLGLQMLQTVSEELGNPRSEYLTTTRRDTLLTLMLQQVPLLLSTLISILDSIAEKQLYFGSPTPPSSPPHPSPVKPGTIMATPPQFHSSSLFSTPPHPSHPSSSSSTTTLPLPSSSSSSSSSIPPCAPLDSHMEEICQSTLTCLSNLFSWMPLSKTVTPHVLDTIFHFAGLGCISVVDATDTYGKLGSLAMDCVIELLVKNCVPREFEVFLMKLFDKSFSLLQRLTGPTETGEVISFSQLDDRFLAKCSDFFYWFVNSHLKRVEFNPNFPVLEFLALFYQYTFKQPEVDSFCVCLDTWGVFLDHLIMMSSGIHGGQSPPTNNHYERYKDVLVGMMDSVLKKIQLHHNIDELREIDDDATDDDNETEWQSFLRQCLEFIAKVAELFPTQAFGQLVPLLESYSHVYLCLGQLFTQSGDGKTTSLAVSESSECEKLHAVLRDLTSVLQALGRLAEDFTGDDFLSRLGDAELLMKKFCVIAQFSAEQILFNVATPFPDILSHDFIEIHAQVLGTIQAYTHWLAKLSHHAHHTGQHTDSYGWFISAIIQFTYPLITRDIPEKVILSACQLLVSLAATVRPKFALTLTEVKALLESGQNGTMELRPHRAQCMVFQALTSMLALPWPETPDSEQQWAWREAELCRLVAGPTKVFRELQERPQWSQDAWFIQQVKPSIKQSLHLLHHLISSLSHQSSKSKSLLLKSISSSLDFAISLFSSCLHHSDVLESLMTFFLSLFKTMGTQVGAALTQRTTQTFMGLLTREHLQETLAEEESTATRVVEKFLKILQLLVQDTSTGGGGGRALLPSIISFTMKQIYPTISSRPAPDVKSALFELLFQLLLNNWRYFYPSTVLTHMDVDETNNSLEHSEEFFSIMEAFGHSLLQQDISLFRQNLKSLEGLNSKQKLYSRPQFREHMLYPLLRILMDSLVQRSHSILQEEICLTVYSMASVDFTTFHHTFVLKYLSAVEAQELSEDHRRTLVASYSVAEDLPSFVLNLQQFVNDLRCYLILSKSLPGGSVSLH